MQFAALVGGKGGGRGRGRGRGSSNRGRGRGQDNRTYGAAGRGKGLQRGCEEISTCLRTVGANPGGKDRQLDRDGNKVADGGVPPAFAAAVMEESLREGHRILEWLRLAASAINVKTLKKCLSTATLCIPASFQRDVHEAELIHKSMLVRQKDLVAHVQEMAVTLHVDTTTFRDGRNKLVDPAIDDATKLLIDGHLYFGGTSIRAVLHIQNEEFRDLIFQKHGAIANATFSRLEYGKEDHSFAISYDTDMGLFEVVFWIGADGRAVQPRADRPGVASREVTLLSPLDAAELERIDARGTSERRSSRSGSRSQTQSQTHGFPKF